MISEEAEDLGTQTVLSCEDMEMWVTHLDAVRNRGKAGASKVAARFNCRMSAQGTYRFYSV